jgi:X-Pro dipeptidyl-peptidase
VTTDNFGQWWSALPPTVHKQIWLSQGGHIEPFNTRRTAFVDELHRWFDHYLMGIDNGVQFGPQASVERAPDHWVDYPAWPIPGTVPTTLRMAPGGTAGVGTLGFAGPKADSSASFTDNPKDTDDDWAANPATTAADRIIYSTAPLTHATTVSGTAKITLTATSSEPEARLSAVLVDYGTSTFRDPDGDGYGVTKLTTQSCFGDSTPLDSACYYDTVPETKTAGFDVFGQGWADLGHYQSLTSQQVLTPGKPYTMTFTFNTTDHTVPAGHTLALIIGGTDKFYINQPAGTPTLNVDLKKSSITLPLSNF